MNALTIFRSLGPIDARNVRRDPLLRWVAVSPLVLALAVRWPLPLLAERLGTWLQFDAQSHYATLAGLTLLLLCPMLVGLVVGFLLLDQRDDHTLTALRVTPLPFSAYLAYRIAVPMLVGVLVTLVAFPVAGLREWSPLAIVAATIAAAPVAPLYALTLAAFAANKVQGFALQKALGVLFVVPIIARFAPPTLQWVFGVVPTYWPARVLWTAQSGGVEWWAFAVALGYQAALLALLLRRVARRSES